MNVNWFEPRTRRRTAARLVASLVVFAVCAELVGLAVYYVDTGALFYTDQPSYEAPLPAPEDRLALSEAVHPYFGFTHRPGTPFDIPAALRTGLEFLPVAVAIHDAGGKEVHLHRFGNLKRRDSVWLELDHVLKVLQEPQSDKHKQEDVLSSRVVSRDGDSQKVYLRLRRTKFVTVVYDTEHLVTFQRHGALRASSGTVLVEWFNVSSGADGAVNAVTVWRSGEPHVPPHLSKEQDIPMQAGDRVLMAFPAANRDPEFFDRPDEVVIDREVNRHAAFGLGIALGAVQAARANSRLDHALSTVSLVSGWSSGRSSIRIATFWFRRLSSARRMRAPVSTGSASGAGAAAASVTVCRVTSEERPVR